jgi:glycosyltransferase involved in cell wall biosynthesis
VVVGGPIYETDGHAGYAEGLHRRTGALGLADRVTFLGARTDVPEILASLDVLVHCPTAPEPLGRVLAEAMAVGRPVVAARSGGIPEVVEEGVTGFLVEPGDVAGFASAVVRLLEDPALRERLGSSGRRRAEARFGVEAHVSAVLDAYRAVTAAA